MKFILVDRKFIKEFICTFAVTNIFSPCPLFEIGEYILYSLSILKIVFIFSYFLCSLFQCIFAIESALTNHLFVLLYICCVGNLEPISSPPRSPEP